MMDVNEQDINAVCFGILCNFPLFCGETRAKEAAELVRVIYTENEKLRAELEHVKQERDATVEALHKLCPAWKWDEQKKAKEI